MKILAFAFAITLAACSSQSTKPAQTVPMPDLEAARLQFVAQCDANPPSDPEQLRVCECARTEGEVCPPAEYNVYVVPGDSY